MAIKKQNKKLLVAVLVVIGVIFIGQMILNSQLKLSSSGKSEGRSFVPESGQASPTIEVKLSKISIDFGNGKKISGEVNAQTAYDALQKIAREKNIIIEIKEYKYGLMVTKIGESAGSGKYYWAFSVNGKTAEIASDRYVLQPGDSVEWKYVK